MPTTFKSPFTTSFKNACKRGTPFYQAVNNIAKKNNKNPQFIWNSLFKADVVWRQKFNSQWIYFPNFPCKTKSSAWKVSQFECWQYFCEWMICSGKCTPEQVKKHCGSQVQFMKWCKKFWGKQYPTTTISRKSTTTKSKPRVKTTSKKRTVSKSYKFPKNRSTSRTRRFTKAA